jgi:hypothetical protein
MKLKEVIEKDYGTIDFNARYKYADVKGEMPTPSGITSH